MVFERTENEPEEYDPEAEFTDPESDSLTIPAVSTAETDVPPELLKTFWALVLVINAAVLAVSLGVLFLVFESDVSIGGPLLGGGIVLFGFAVYRYRSFRRSSDDDAGEDGDSDVIEDDDAGESRGGSDADVAVDDADSRPGSSSPAADPIDESATSRSDDPESGSSTDSTD